MERPFPAYKGDDSYIFVSYAHADADEVYPEITWLKEAGINIWYDEGISAGHSPITQRTAPVAFSVP